MQQATHNPFVKAERKQAKLRLALCGVAGAGKTYSALKIATGLGGRIAMIDTERKSGHLYSDLAEYDIVDLAAPFDPERYIKFIKDAEAAGYATLIIDSFSHAWSGVGGILEIVDKVSAASRSGNSYTAWRNVTPRHNLLVDTILAANMHIIVTMRSKADYDMSKSADGKTEIKKVGLAPIQREGVDYEFTTVLDLSLDRHVASSSKDRTGLFDGKFEVLSEATGQKLKAWLAAGVVETTAPQITLVTDSQADTEAAKELETNKINSLINKALDAVAANDDLLKLNEIYNFVLNKLIKQREHPVYIKKMAILKAEYSQKIAGKISNVISKAVDAVAAAEDIKTINDLQNSVAEQLVQNMHEPAYVEGMKIFNAECKKKSGSLKQS